MATPNQQYMTLVGGEDHATYTSNKIIVGDTIRISGSDSNDGVYTVLDRVVGDETVGSAGKDIHYVLRGRGLTTEATSDVAVTIDIQRGSGDKLIALGRADEVDGEQISEVNNRTFASTTGIDWANGAGSNAVDGYNNASTTGATEGTYFTDPYLELGPDDDGSNRQWALLDGANWEDNDGGSGEAMSIGRTYRLSYSVEIEDYSKGTMTVGFCNDSHTLQSDKNTYTANTSARTDSFDFVYQGTAVHSKIIIDFAVSTEMTSYLDNFSLKSLDNPAGGIDVWSYGSVSTPANENDGWTQRAITPTISGNDNKYIFHFVDEGLRVCNTNEQNASINKWYGYIQRNQFGLDEGLSFNEWQEHPNNLKPPANVAGVSFGILTSNHTSTVAANYHVEDTNIVRGNKYILRNGTSDLQVDSPSVAISTSVTNIGFEDSGGTNANDQLNSGDVVSIGTNDLTVLPQEFLLVNRPAFNFNSVVFKRSYGGTTANTYADNLTPIVVRGAAFNIAVTEDSTAGLWPSNSWEFYQTFIYDGSQESLPVAVGNGAASVAKASLDNTTGNKRLKVSVYADVAYNGRISGGRFYMREKDSKEPLTLFAEIDIVNGVRLSLLDKYTSWSFNTTNADGFYVSSLYSEGPNIDTYSSLNGFSSEEKFIAIGSQGELYKASIVANRRTFIANVRIKNANNEIIHYGDRIMYSEINKFDTFLDSNFIDVSKGDYGGYVALEEYADRLLAFKPSKLHIINISSPNPSSWFLENSMPHVGISHKFSVCKTEFGVAWANEKGCFLYNGESVSNLLDGKVGVTSTNQLMPWNDFVNGSSNVKDVMVGYDSINNTLIIMRSPNDSTVQSNISFLFNFNSGAWTVNDAMFADSRYYSNFSQDWNNNLIVAREVDDSDDDAIEIQKYISPGIHHANQEFVTKDLDFGMPGITKKVYSISVTYKQVLNNNNAVNFQYSTNGKNKWTDISSYITDTSTVVKQADGSTDNTIDGSAVSADYTANSFAVDYVGAFSIGDLILTTGECMIIKHISGSTLTVERGIFGTGPASLSSTNQIFKVEWKTKKLSLPSIESCQSIQFRYKPSTSSYTEINDITVEFRPIRGKIVSDG
tara:strand:+ start:1535 stop:4843 length:3309 start_codon:yes stop_codon:yes gene_type:complete